MVIERGDLGPRLQPPPDCIDVPEQAEPIAEATSIEPFGKVEARGPEDLVRLGPVAVLVVEAELRIGAVVGVVERRGLDEPGVASWPHQPAELAGKDPS